jgi:hypothetical protein
VVWLAQKSNKTKRPIGKPVGLLSFLRVAPSRSPAHNGGEVSVAHVIQSLVADSRPRSAYLWPEVKPNQQFRSASETFAFQYWPESLTDTEQPRYSEKEVPGASHPLYQWTGGGGRDISFTAIFTAEVDDTSQVSQDASPGGAAVSPSARYTVDVKAAVARIKTWLRGDYTQFSLDQATRPPSRLFLVLEGSNLGGNTDAILTVLKSAPITYEAWFPSGNPRVVSIQMTFSECIQRMGGNGETSQIAYLGRSSFQVAGAKYKYRGSVDRT